jgi:cell division protein FtsL
MTKNILFVLCMVPAIAFAQPSGSGSAPAPAPGSGSAPETPAPPPEAPKPDAEQLRKICVDAMNADAQFAKKIVETADENAAQVRLQLDTEQHQKAAAAIAKNEKHVIMAYAALWLVAIAFVIFLWLRQQALRKEIAHLKADLDAATKDAK